MHLSLKGAVGRNPLLNKVGKPLLSIDDAAAAYSLRSLGSGNPRVARVRRSSDDAEKDFYAADMGSGSVADWVNGKQDTTLPCDVASAAAAYSLRSVNSNYAGSVVRVRRSSDDAEKDFTASDVSGSALVDWVNSVVDLVSSDLSDSTWNETGGGTATFSANGVSGGSGPRQVLSNKVFPQGTKLRVKINLTANSSNTTQLGVHFYNVNNGSLTPIAPNGAASRNVDSEFTLTADSKIRIRAEGGTTVDWSFSNLSVTSILANGHVTTWYDQSGNGNNATQSTAGSQPKIVDAGVLVSGGIDFDGVNDYLQNVDVVRAAPHTAFAVWSPDIITGIEVVTDGIGSGFASALYRAADDANIYAGSILAGGVNLSPNDTILHYGLFNGANSENGVNGSAPVIGNPGNENPSGIRVGGVRSLTASSFFDGKVAEIIVYNSDQSANRFKIESNINNHYGLYTNANDGFVTTWYDQSGNDNDATQSTAGSQPKIVDAGVYLEELDIPTSGNNLIASEIPFQNQNAFTFSGNFIFNLGSLNGIFGIHNSSNRSFDSSILIRMYATNQEIVFIYYNGTANYRSAIVNYSHGGNLTNLFISFDGTSAPEISVNGVSKTVTESTVGSTPPDWTDAISGNYFIFGQGYSYGSRSKTVSEILFYDSDQSSNRTAIEANINNHYDIY